MGKYTFEGLQTSLEGVPQTQFFLTGKNLPGPSKKHSEQPKEEEPRSALEDIRDWELPMSLSPQEIKEIVDLVLSEEAATEEAPNRTIISWIQDCITALRDPKKILQKLRRRP